MWLERMSLPMSWSIPATKASSTGALSTSRARRRAVNATATEWSHSSPRWRP